MLDSWLSRRGSASAAALDVLADRLRAAGLSANALTGAQRLRWGRHTLR